jgi:hypothetical protein
MAAAEHEDDDVRVAAISALGGLPGSRDAAVLLARIAAGSAAADANAARQSLARLNGPEVAGVILAGAERGDPSLRAVYLEQLALRGMTESLPLLRKLRTDPSAAVRAAAVGALGDLAPASEQKAVLDWTIEAKDPNEQARALRSLVNVTLRNPNHGERGKAVYALVEYAQPELALRLLPALARIGGAPSAQTAARLAMRDDPGVADAATSALASWPDDTALPALVAVAEKAALPASRTIALDAALDDLGRDRRPWAAETTALVSRLLASTTNIERRRKLVAVLHRANDRAALTLAESLKPDETIAGEAAMAAEIVRANLAGPPKLRGSTESGLANMLDGKTSTRWSTPALGEEWIEADFNLSRPLRRVTLDQTGRAAEFPERYELFVTDDPNQPGAALASGPGQRNRTIIMLPDGTRGRYLLIRNTAERKDTPWAICELIVE